MVRVILSPERVVGSGLRAGRRVGNNAMGEWWRCGCCPRISQTASSISFMSEGEGREKAGTAKDGKMDKKKHKLQTSALVHAHEGEGGG